MSASSRPRSSTDLTSALTSVFECPVCLDPVMPPIAQCVNGHLLCFPCRNQVDVCPLCRQSISNVRALAMEKVAEKFPYPCNYSDYGCTAKPILLDKPDHEKTCEFRPCACVFVAEVCKWTGPPKDMPAHIREAHKSLTIYRGEKIGFVYVRGVHPETVRRTEVRTLQSCFGQHFLLVLARQQSGSLNLTHVLLQNLGTPKDAEEFTYQLEIGDDERTLTWTSRPSSVLEGIEAAMARGNGLVFDSRCFAPDAKLNVRVTVKRRSSTEEGGSDTRDSYFRMFGAPGKNSSDVPDGGCKQTIRKNEDSGERKQASGVNEEKDFRDSYFRMFKPRVNQYP